MKTNEKGWMYFKGAKKRSPYPLTLEQERKRNEIWARWLAAGKRATLGRWNMASACARAATAFPRDKAWCLKMMKARALARRKRMFSHLLNEKGNLPFAMGKMSAKEASRRGAEKLRLLREERKRIASGGKLKHFIPGG